MIEWIAVNEEEEDAEESDQSLDFDDLERMVD